LYDEKASHDCRRAARARHPAMALTPGGPVTGNTLVNWCTSYKSNWYEGWCLGFVLGVGNTTQLCAPGGDLQSSQMRAVVVRYLYRHPERWAMEGSKLVLEAYKDAWPCQ
jgi:hypothetical protein